jgi:hypothetical protein
MSTAHITRLVTFAQSCQPKEYGGSDMMRADLEALISTAAGVARIVAVPQGWQLVPQQWTSQMAHAGFMVHRHKDIACQECGDIYRAMLAAAPEPPAINAAEDDERERAAFKANLLADGCGWTERKLARDANGTWCNANVGLIWLGWKKRAHAVGVDSLDGAKHG